MNYFYFLFQSSDKKIAMEMNLNGEADIKVDSEEFLDANNDQANCDGTMWIIIRFFTVFIMHTFYCCFYNRFHDYDFIPVKYGSLYLSLFFGHAEEMASVYDEIDIKEEPLFPSLECDQVCSVYFMILTLIIVLMCMIYFKLDPFVNKYHPLLKLKYYY